MQKGFTSSAVVFISWSFHYLQGREASLKSLALDSVGWAGCSCSKWISCQWCGTRPSVLGQDRSETKKSVSVLVLQVWCCVVKHGLVTLVVVMILKDTGTVQVLFIISLFCAWNITSQLLFAAAGPAAWISLPVNIRNIRSHSAFCRQLKTYLFTVPD